MPKPSNRTISKIHAFRQLKQGWHYGEGDPIEEAVINRAVAFHDLITQLGFYETSAFPALDGGIVLSVYVLPVYLDFELLPNGLVDYCRENDETIQAIEDGITDEMAKDRLMQFAVSSMNLRPHQH